MLQKFLALKYIVDIHKVTWKDHSKILPEVIFRKKISTVNYFSENKRQEKQQQQQQK